MPYTLVVAPVGVKFGMAEGTEGTEEGNFGPLLHAKFHPHRCNDKGVEPKKLKYFYSDLTKMWNINALQGRIHCAIFTKFAEFGPHFRMRYALGVKIWLDLPKGLWSYGGFKLRGSGFPRIFSAP